MTEGRWFSLKPDEVFLRVCLPSFGSSPGELFGVNSC